MSNALLASVLRDPTRASALSPARWNDLLAAAHGELLCGSLALRLEREEVPTEVAPVLADARIDAAAWERAALWEAVMAARALVHLAGPVVLLKGTAYVMAGLDAGRGRHVGDIDLLVARDQLDRGEKALLDHGWSWVKQDEYDDAYYRKWMHELPPLIHSGRDKMADMHHTILPLTHRIAPDAAAMLADAVPLADPGPGHARLFMLAPADMLCHCAAHLIADGDLAGGMRNLWDFHLLYGQFSGADPGFAEAMEARAALHGLNRVVRRAARLAHRLYGTEIPAGWRELTPSDRLFRNRLLARRGSGREARWWVRQGFYVRSHWMRMPPAMLTRHLWTKARR